MAIGSGLASQLALSKESTYGTRVVPAKWYEFESETLSCERNRIVSRGLRAGRTFQNSGRRVTTTRTAGGGISLEVPNKNFGAIADLLHGEAVTPVQQAATTAYLQTHNLGTSDPSKSATIQVGRPDTGGTVRPFDYLGAMVTEWGFSCDTGGFLMANLTFDAQDEKTAETLATPAYPSGLASFHFAQCTVTINSVAATNKLNSVSITGGLARKTDRFYLGSTGVKAKPIQNDYSTAAVTFGGDFTDLTYYGLYTADTIFPVVIDFQGALIASTYYERVKFTIAAAQADGGTPNVGGPDVVEQPLTLTTLDNGTDPPVKLEVTSTDVTI